MIRLLVALAILSFSLVAGAQTACNQAVNPHSFACVDATFLGKIFKLVPMNTQVIQGPWTLFTYADVHGKTGPEFFVSVNPKDPRIPEGVHNTSDRSIVGPLDWTVGDVRFLNWQSQGRTLQEFRGRTAITDNFTIATPFQGNGTANQALQCRVFLRENADHLLCRWMTQSGNQFILRGYLGFLRSR